MREAEPLDGLSRLLTKGRSKGACVVLGFQDIEGMREVYGEKVANEIIGQCNSKALLRLSSPETAQWASDLSGKYLRWEKQTSSSHSQGHSKEGTSSNSEAGESYSLQERPAAYSSEFLSLPFPHPDYGMTAFYITEEGFYRKTFNPFPLLPKRDALIRDFWKRPDSEQYLHPWSESEQNSFNDAEEEKTPSTPTEKYPFDMSGIDELEEAEEETDRSEAPPRRLNESGESDPHFFDRIRRRSQDENNEVRS